MNIKEAKTDLTQSVNQNQPHPLPRPTAPPNQRGIPTIEGIRIRRGQECASKDDRERQEQDMKEVKITLD